MATGPAQDFDFHPDEDAVRVFACEPAGVLHLAAMPRSGPRATADERASPLYPLYQTLAFEGIQGLDHSPAC